MALYMIRTRYSAAAFQGMLATPRDRGEAVKALSKTIGMKTHEVLYSISTGSLVALLEGTAEQMAQIQMIVMGSGAISDAIVEEMISTKTLIATMKTAGAKAGEYKAANKK